MRYIKSFTELESKNAGLKIPSWVTLTCRFKSGPGHQKPVVTGDYTDHKSQTVNADRSRKEASGAPTDTPVTHEVARG